MGLFSKLFKKPTDKAVETMDKASAAIEETKDSIKQVSKSANDLIQNGNRKIESIATLLVIATGASLIASCFSIAFSVKAMRATSVKTSIPPIYIIKGDK